MRYTVDTRYTIDTRTHLTKIWCVHMSLFVVMSAVQVVYRHDCGSTLSLRLILKDQRHETT